ncbi:hypothetical protein EB001_21110 [bacterium]|nr:hypothetical protein [bacterium]
MSTIKVNAIQHTTANASNMTLFANGNVAMTTANTTLTVGNTTISNSGISVAGAAINPLATGMRNKFINGDMRVDQRYSGSANTINTGASQYILDRWAFNNGSGTGVYTVRQMDSANTSASNYESGSAPPGFINSFKMTVTTANTTTSSSSYAGFWQPVEGLTITDLDWGKSTAKPVTLSFWVKSNITGQFSWAIFNYNSTRVYPASVTINSANTWEYKSFTIPGDTTGTWLTNNSVGLYFQLWPVLGSSYLTSSAGWNASALYGITGQTNWAATVGNTFYITGVQLEAGAVATPFEWRHYGHELALCQRYLPAFRYDGIGATAYVNMCSMYSTGTTGLIHLFLPVTTRVPPTGITTSGASTFSISDGDSGAALTALTFSAATDKNMSLNFSVGSARTAFRPHHMYSATSASYIFGTGCEL